MGMQHMLRGLPCTACTCSIYLSSHCCTQGCEADVKAAVTRHAQAQVDSGDHRAQLGANSKLEVCDWQHALRASSSRSNKACMLPAAGNLHMASTQAQLRMAAGGCTPQA